MGDVISLERKPEWLLSVDLYRDPDGGLACVLADARTSLIEREGEPADAVLNFADMVQAGLDRMRAHARKLKD